MNIELAETLQLIIDRYHGRTQGSVFIKMKDFSWHNEMNGQLTKLHEMGYITKPRFYDDGADITLTNSGRTCFTEKHWILFPEVHRSLVCPVCGHKAEVLNTDAEKSWAEIYCDNCSTYALKPDALEDVSPSDLSLLSAYYRHVRRQPLTIQCDDKNSVRQHIEATRENVTHEYQMRALLSHYYQNMTKYSDYMTVEMLPAIAYVQDEDELRALMHEGEEQGLLRVEGELINVTKAGKEFIDLHSTEAKKVKPTVFISYNWVSGKSIVKDLEKKIESYAEVVRDEKSVKPWGDLTAFMKSIRTQDFAVLILSDAYLKSEGCLYEVVLLMKDENWDKSVMYVVTDDARGIYDTCKQLDYIEFWTEKASQLEKGIAKLPPALTVEQSKELKKIKAIEANIGTFMAKVKSTNNPNMDVVIDEIVKRVRG